MLKMIIMRILTLLISFLCVSSTLFAQELSSTTTNNSAESAIASKSFFAELGGPGILFSVNFDTRFKKSNLGFGGRVGLGFVSGWESTYDTTWGSYYSDRRRSVLTLPVQINYLFGKPNSAHSFEVGIGATYVGKKIDIMDFYEDERTNLFGTASFMYRRTPKNGGFSWRIGFTPLFANGYIQPFGAVSVGYNF